MTNHVNVKFKNIHVRKSERYGVDGEPGNSAEWRMVLAVTDHESRPIKQHLWNKDEVRDDRTYNLGYETIVALPAKGFGVKVAGHEDDDIFGGDDIKDTFRWHTPEPGWKAGQTYKLAANILEPMDYTVEYSIEYVDLNKRMSVPEWAHVAAIARSTDKLDLFVTDVDRKIRTAAGNRASPTAGAAGARSMAAGQARALRAMRCPATRTSWIFLSSPIRSSSRLPGAGLDERLARLVDYPRRQGAGRTHHRGLAQQRQVGCIRRGSGWSCHDRSLGTGLYRRLARLAAGRRCEGSAWRVHQCDLAQHGQARPLRHRRQGQDPDRFLGTELH